VLFNRWIYTHVKLYGLLPARAGWKERRRKHIARRDASRVSPANSTPGKIDDRERLISRCIGEFYSSIFLFCRTTATGVSFIVNASSFAVCEIFRLPQFQHQFPPYALSCVGPECGCALPRIACTVWTMNTSNVNGDSIRKRYWYIDQRMLCICMLLMIYYLRYYAYF